MDENTIKDIANCIVTMEQSNNLLLELSYTDYQKVLINRSKCIKTIKDAINNNDVYKALELFREYYDILSPSNLK